MVFKAALGLIAGGLFGFLLSAVSRRVGGG